MMQVLVKCSLRDYQFSGSLIGDGTDKREKWAYTKGTDEDDRQSSESSLDLLLFWKSVL